MYCIVVFTLKYNTYTGDFEDFDPTCFAHSAGHLRVPLTRTICVQTCFEQSATFFSLSAKMSEKRSEKDSRKPTVIQSKGDGTNNSGILRDTLDTLWEWNEIEGDCNV